VASRRGYNNSERGFLLKITHKGDVSVTTPLRQLGTDKAAGAPRHYAAAIMALIQEYTLEVTRK
jgi:hypothetical protein